MTLRAIIDALLRLLGSPDMSRAEVEAALVKRALEKGQASNWRESIVDLLKLLDLDSSLEARKALAAELGYTGSDEDGSAAKNMWLHAKVMRKVSEHGIKVPVF